MMFNLSIAVLFGMFMGFVEWAFYVLGIICMIKYLFGKKKV